MGEVRAEGLLRAIGPAARPETASQGFRPRGRTASRMARDAGLATERNRHPLASAGNLAVVGAPIAWCARAGLARYGIFAGTGFP